MKKYTKGYSITEIYISLLLFTITTICFGKSFINLKMMNYKSELIIKSILNGNDG